MGYRGLSVLTAVKHFWYLHNDVNYCSVRALAKCPASCERSHCWHCLCSPGICPDLRLDDTAAAERLTYSEEILVYEIKEGTKMPGACGCPGGAAELGVGSSFPMLETAANDCEHQLIYGQMEEETPCAGGPDLWFCSIINQLIVFISFFSSCTANKRTPGGPLLHHLHWLRSVHLLLDDHAGHICYIVVSNFNLIPAEQLSCRKPSAAFQATG